jgi:hypothetical protein
MQQQLHQFYLAIEPLPNASYALTVLQRPFPAERYGRDLPLVNMGRIAGLALISTQDLVLDVLRANHYKPADLHYERSMQLGLNEEGGVRLSVLFRAISPLSSLDHIRVLQQAVWAMSPEETYYWFAKCHGTNGQRGGVH